MTKYVLCKGYYGMGGNLAVVLCGLRLARHTGRELVVDWIDGVYGLAGKDIFKLLFEKPRYSVTREELSNLTVWPPYWQKHVTATMPYNKEYPLHRVHAELAEAEGFDALQPFDVIMVTRDDKYWHKGTYRKEMTRLAQELVPTHHLRERIAAFRQTFLGAAPIAVHFRHGNGEPTVVPPDIHWFFVAVDKFLKKSPWSKIFVCTDCAAVLDRFSERYGDKVISTEKEYPPLGAGSMHAKNVDQDRLARAEEAIVDMWLMSKCSYVVGSKSFFSGVAMKLSPELCGPNVAVWKPKHRSHKPEPGHISVGEIDDVATVLQEAGLKLDGLFVEYDEHHYGRLFYLYEPLCGFKYPGDIDVANISTKLSDIRLY